jgi:4-hydroxy 2-oxovalerate aldolase
MVKSSAAQARPDRFNRLRPELNVVDCTIRDGGLMNQSKFTLACVQAVYRAVCQSGVQVVELGYRNSRKLFDPEVFGAWRFCDDAMIRQVIGDHKYPGTRIAVMMDAHKSELDDLKPRAQSPVDLVRIATYVEDLDRAIRLENDARAKGYDTALSIMALSKVAEAALDACLVRIRRETQVQVCYIVDSFGTFDPEDLAHLVAKYQRQLPGIEVGIHAHNNQQLAFANTLEGLKLGANYLDGTLYGLGRGAGNCNLELLVGFLKNPKYDLGPLLEVIAAHILPLQKDITWGYSVPYLVTGLLNRHQDEGTELQALPDQDPAKYAFRAFYERMALPEPAPAPAAPVAQAVAAATAGRPAPRTGPAATVVRQARSLALAAAVLR